MQLNENLFTWRRFAFEYQRLLEKEYTDFASIKYPKAAVTTIFLGDISLCGLG